MRYHDAPRYRSRPSLPGCSRRQRSIHRSQPHRHAAPPNICTIAGAGQAQAGPCHKRLDQRQALSRRYFWDTASVRAPAVFARLRADREDEEILPCGLSSDPITSTSAHSHQACLLAGTRLESLSTVCEPRAPKRRQTTRAFRAISSQPSCSLSILSWGSPRDAVRATAASPSASTPSSAHRRGQHGAAIEFVTSPAINDCMQI